MVGRRHAQHLRQCRELGRLRLPGHDPVRLPARHEPQLLPRYRYHREHIRPGRHEHHRAAVHRHQPAHHRVVPHRGRPLVSHDPHHRPARPARREPRRRLLAHPVPLGPGLGPYVSCDPLLGHHRPRARAPRRQRQVRAAPRSAVKGPARPRHRHRRGDGAHCRVDRRLLRRVHDHPRHRGRSLALRAPRLSQAPARRRDPVRRSRSPLRYRIPARAAHAPR